MPSRDEAPGLRECSRLSRVPELVEIGDAPFSTDREAGTELGAGGGRSGRDMGGVDVGAGREMGGVDVDAGLGLVSRESSSVS